MLAPYKLAAPLLQKILQPIGLQRLIFPGDYITHQLLVSGSIFPCQYHAGLHSWMTRQPCFDLSPSSDSISAYLHLVVDTAQKLQRPVLAIANQISGFVQARSTPAGKWIGQEPFSCRSSRPVQISAAYASATDIVRRLFRAAPGENPGLEHRAVYWR